ncbi:hypothetical protein [Pyrobaculum aerophilum]|uniref:hypothetical protein n=1 Tax=Pyrobaculum aerophilum TaxID=13773 RepID=UPI0023F244CB|nr:hypothetical protein [Pyrobaculum aerophilum]MCX8137127.1 hypothetical protein [Pyrobaculum aerophilum]
MREIKLLLFFTLPLLAFFGLLSGPLAEAGVKEALSRYLSIGPGEEDFAARVIMAYHIAAVVVMAGTLYLAAKYVDHEPNTGRIAVNLATAGWLIAVPSDLAFAYFGRSPLAHGLWLVGLSLMFAAGLVFLYSISPWRLSWRERTLERATAFTVGATLLIAVIMGAIYAAHLGFDENVKIYILEEHSTREYRGLAPASTPLQLLISGHAHAAVALWAAAVMFIGMKWARMDNWRPKLYKITLALTAIGALITLIGSAAVAVVRPIAHQIIFGGIGPLHLALFFLWLRLGGMLKGGGWRDPVKLGLFLVPIWTVVFVTSTGPMLASQTKTVRLVWPLEDEIAYNVAHWHMLAFIIASAMFLLYLSEFAGRIRQISGFLLAIGGTVALAGAFIYELSPLFARKAGVKLAPASAALKKGILPVIDAGLALSFAAFALFVLWLFVKTVRKA